MHVSGGGRQVCGEFRGAYVVGECLPVLVVDEGYDTAGGFWCAPVVLTSWLLVALVCRDNAYNLDVCSF